MRTALCLVFAFAFLNQGCGSSTESERRIPQLPQVTAADEIAARARLLGIAKAEMMYEVETGGTFATLKQLIDKGYTNDPSAGKLARYKFDVEVKPGGFAATAVPEKYGITGFQSFYVDESGTLHGGDKKGEKATADDAPL